LSAQIAQTSFRSLSHKRRAVTLSDAVSKRRPERYNGCVTIDGDLLRVRLGRVPRTHSDDGDLAPQLEPIPISDILVEE
jgi:hypothetical protein